MPRRRASATAVSITGAISEAMISLAAGMGLATTTPPFNPMLHLAFMSWATSSGVSQRMGTAWPELLRIEGRKLIGAIAHHGHAEGFEHFEGERQIQNGFRPGRHHGHIAFGKFHHVGGNIETPAPPRCTPPMPPVANT